MENAARIQQTLQLPLKFSSLICKNLYTGSKTGEDLLKECTCNASGRLATECHQLYPFANMLYHNQNIPLPALTHW